MGDPGTCEFVFRTRYSEGFLSSRAFSDNIIVMEKKITITTHAQQRASDRQYWLSQTPEARLNEVERLRIEAGNFLYEYPARLQRVISITRKAQR